MSHVIRKVGVIGAGVMGGGIAAHLANAGILVVLLDIVPPNLTDAEKKDPNARNRFSAGGLDKAIKARPAAFFHKSGARLVSIGNIEDDLQKLSSCDLVIEAVIEKLEPKQALFAQLEKVLPEHAIVASNTSGLRIHDMVQGRSDGFKKRFLVMHFFNPVRYMKLLELVIGPETAQETLSAITKFGEDQLGKGIVVGKDTPNFIGNRIGTYAMMVGIHQMLKDGLSPEDVDNITGTPMGHPKSASFRTADLVGLDTFIHVADNCHAALTTDEERAVFEVPAFIRTMAEKKLLGNKTKGGFYKKVGKDILTFDPKTLDYRAKGGDEGIKSATKSISRIEETGPRLKKLVADQGKAGAFAWTVLSRSLAYAARRIPEISDSVIAIDDAMKWGYNWELGPFETWDALGFVETVERMDKDGVALPDSIKKMKAAGATSFYKGNEVWDLQTGKYVAREIDPRNATIDTVRKGGAAVLKNDGAEAWDMGDGVLGLTFKTKMNSLDPDVIKMLGDAADRAEKDFRALIVVNKGEHFCVGANLALLAMSAGMGQWDQIREMVKGYQMATQRLKYARVPVVIAPYGMAVGGGMELCFAGDAVQAAAETYCGLVECGVAGLVPGGAGTMNMLWRALEGIPEGANVNTYEYVTQVFKNIAMAKVATSAVEAKHFGYFRHTDGVTFDKARLVNDAKNKAIGLAEAGYHPVSPRAFILPGESGIATLKMMVGTLVAGGYATPHDAVVAGKLAEVLCGGKGGASREVTEDEILELEREAFVSLCGEPNTQARIQFFLMNNKPLRN
jgi:3-hydroxyacyl-CoA dehydrogenase